MEDGSDTPSTSSPPSNEVPKESIIDSNLPECQNPSSSEKSISITLSPGSSLVVSGGEKESVTRRPFRPMSGASQASPSRASKSRQSIQKKSSSREKRIKCVLVGDSRTGKSTLVQSFLHGQSGTPPDHVPTLQDTYFYEGKAPYADGVEKKDKAGENSTAANKELNGKESNITLQICDTGGQEEMDRLRPLCYDQAQMVIICFSVMNPTSFSNVTMKWLPELKRHCVGTEESDNPLKLLLVGTQSDLRSNVNLLLKLMDDGLSPISETQALRLAHKIGALKYVESSSLSKSNINHIFDLVMTYGNAKNPPKQLMGLPMDTGLQEKLLPNLTERKLLFWRRWRVRQNKSSSKMKRLVLLPCFF